MVFIFQIAEISPIIHSSYSQFTICFAVTFVHSLKPILIVSLDELRIPTGSFVCSPSDLTFQELLSRFYFV